VNVKIQSVALNNHRRAFEIALAGRGKFSFPYGKADPEPTPEDPVDQVFVDPELGGEGVTYRLQSGREGSVLSDHVLEYHRDPSTMRDLMLHQLTVEAVRRVEESPLGIREISRRLSTSPTQLYRLLDPANHGKTVDRMLELLQVLDAEVEVRVK